MDLEFTILLPGGGVFHFSGPFPMSDTQWDHIRQVMDAMAPGLITSDDDECSSSGRNPHRQVRKDLQNGSSARQF
jgi:hypothetical protein